MTRTVNQAEGTKALAGPGCRVHHTPRRHQEQPPRHPDATPPKMEPCFLRPTGLLRAETGRRSKASRACGVDGLGCRATPRGFLVLDGGRGKGDPTKQSTARDLRERAHGPSGASAPNNIYMWAGHRPWGNTARE